MNILLSNDDGLYSEGIIELAKAFSKKHNVLIVAPDGNRSATSHSLSIFKNIKVTKKVIDEISGVDCFAMSGTPADCVKFAHHELSKIFPIDAVVAGINKGHNLGSDILYSGTVSVAFEGASLGYKSMAFSCTSHDHGDYKEIAKVCVELFDKLFPYTDTKHIWNVNVPPISIKDIKGVKYTPLGKQVYSDNYQKISDDEYILVGEMIDDGANSIDCDIKWSVNGYITVTPLICDKTDIKTLETVKNL